MFQEYRENLRREVPKELGHCGCLVKVGEEGPRWSILHCLDELADSSAQSDEEEECLPEWGECMFRRLCEVRIQMPRPADRWWRSLVLGWQRRGWPRLDSGTSSIGPGHRRSLVVMCQRVSVRNWHWDLHSPLATLRTFPRSEIGRFPSCRRCYLQQLGKSYALLPPHQIQSFGAAPKDRPPQSSMGWYSWTSCPETRN